MKKIILSVFAFSICISLLASRPIIVNEKVLKAFNKTFKFAEEVRWSEYTNFYEVNFKQNQIKTKITYSEDGLILRTIRYYGGEQLPLLIFTKIKDRYSNKSIFGVVEESSEEGVIYHVSMQDEKSWLIIKADDYGTLSVENKYKKA